MWETLSLRKGWIDEVAKRVGLEAQRTGRGRPSRAWQWPSVGVVSRMSGWAARSFEQITPHPFAHKSPPVNLESSSEKALSWTRKTPEIETSKKKSKTFLGVKELRAWKPCHFAIFLKAIWHFSILLRSILLILLRSRETEKPLQLAPSPSLDKVKSRARLALSKEMLVSGSSLPKLWQGCYWRKWSQGPGKEGS